MYVFICRKSARLMDGYTQHCQGKYFDEKKLIELFNLRYNQVYLQRNFRIIKYSS